MLISEKSKKIIDSCRFCWMCRHLCPIGNATGQERNTSRARALALSLVERGAAQLSGDIIDNVYECALCGGCTNNCVTGWDPTVFTKEARTEAAMNGVTPDYIQKLLDRMESCGNVYGAALDEKLAAAIDALPGSDTLLFLGMDARYKVPQAALDAIAALQKAGVSFTALKDEPNSGWAMDTLVGAAEETKEMMTKAALVLNQYKTVIVFDPCDAKSFTREYKEWGIELTAEVKTITAVYAEQLAAGKLKLSKTDAEVAYQDPALLVREVGEEEEPRAVINACAQLKDLLLCRKEVIFAGNLLMAEYMPDVMKKVAEKRWENVLAHGVRTLITASPSENAVLASAKPEDCELKSMEQLILGA